MADDEITGGIIVRDGFESFVVTPGREEEAQQFLEAQGAAAKLKNQSCYLRTCPVGPYIEIGLRPEPPEKPNRDPLPSDI